MFISPTLKLNTFHRFDLVKFLGNDRCNGCSASGIFTDYQIANLTDGFTFEDSTGKVTVKNAGLYRLTATAEGGGGTNTWKALEIHVNDTLKQRFRMYSNSHAVVGGTTVLELKDNDVLTLKHYQGYVANYFLDSFRLYFGGELIV